MQSARVILAPGGFPVPGCGRTSPRGSRQDGIESIAVGLPTIGEDSAGADF